jgi:methoxymalonate biosynthesis protein
VTRGSVAPGGARLVKCVVWDIDNTLLNGVYLESAGTLPGTDPVVAAALAEFAARGIIHAIASKNPPEAAAHVARVTGREFAAVECGWGRKSDAVARIAASLGIGTDALAFVDDDPYERAEVGTALPDVLVLAPEEVTDAASWPEFGATAVTDEARRRGEMYAARRRRQDAERAFGGNREEFLASAGTQVTIAAATAADVPRLHELVARTRQFNSAGQAVADGEFAALISSHGQGASDEVTGAFRRSGGSGPSGSGPLGSAGVPRESAVLGDTVSPRAGTSDVVTVRLRDAFGDDGIVGACVTSHDADGVWTVRLLAISCRAMGRGVIGAVLAWLVRAAARAGGRAVAVPCVLNDRNVPLRLALASAGFRASAGAAGSPAFLAGPGQDDPVNGDEKAGGAPVVTVFRRDVDTALPELPSWVTGPGEHGAPGAPPEPEGHGPAGPVADQIRAMLAALTGRPELGTLPVDAALFGDAVGLDSLTGTLLLREIERRYGVDVAAEDLNLDALATLGTLALFVAGRAG